jgi:hypothetical protein
MVSFNLRYAKYHRKEDERRIGQPLKKSIHKIEKTDQYRVLAILIRLKSSICYLLNIFFCESSKDTA